VNVLFIYDRFFEPEKLGEISANQEDLVLLFPLTSRESLTNAVEEGLRKRGCTVTVIQTAREIETSADTIREKYIQFIAEFPNRVLHNGKSLRDVFSIDKNLSLWWLGLVAEKNRLKTDTFDLLVQLDAVVRIVTSNGVGKIVMGCSNKRLRAALAHYTKRSGVRYETVSTRGKTGMGIKRRLLELQRLLYLKHVLALMYFAVRFFWRTLQVKRAMGSTKRVRGRVAPLMIITYFPNFDRASAEKGVFRNNYFEHVQQSLEREGRNIVWAAMSVPHGSITFSESLAYAKQFDNNGYPLILVEEFSSLSLQISSFLRMLVFGLRFIRLERRIAACHEINGYNFYLLMRDDWYASFTGRIGYDGIMYYGMFKELLRRVKADRCLYYCEMHAWEKALAAARNAVSPDMRLLGYQHSTVPKMLLNYFFAPEELRGDVSYPLPLPDMLACNGFLHQSYMKESGWPEERLPIVEAIRFYHLKKHIGKEWKKSGNVVIVILSISIESSCALLNIIYEALQGVENVEIWLKPHPFLNLKEALALSEMHVTTGRFKIKDGSIEDLLIDARVAVVGDSSVAVEALAFGCSVITVSTPEMVNTSPLRGMTNRMISNVESPGELREKILSILNAPADIAPSASETADMLHNFFFLGSEDNIPKQFLKLLTHEHSEKKRA